MADVNVAVQKILRTNELTLATTAEAAKSYSEGDVVYVDTSGCKRVVLAITAGAASAVMTIAKGTGIAGVKDMVISPTNGKVQFIELDTSAFEDVNAKLANGNTNPAYGKIKITATTKGGTMSAVAIL